MNKYTRNTAYKKKEKKKKIPPEERQYSKKRKTPYTARIKEKPNAHFIPT